MTYRPSIEGLRAIAVLSVLLFHLHRAALPGGFVGVDVFFVISGYLITAGLYADCEAGTFRFSRFYQRRVARILPVLLLVSIATLIAAGLLFNARDLSTTGGLASASALSIVNFALVRLGSYFEASTDALPLLHCWSLSLEEQFYIVLPLALWGAFALAWSRRRLLFAIGVALALSFIGSIWLTSIHPKWAFYLLPPRGWELLSGSMLGIVLSREGPREYRRRDELLSLLGLLFVGLAIFVMPEGNAFPGYVAALPVLGAVLIIGWSRHRALLTEKLLSRSALTAIGQRSYSIYLWHWPVYCFVDYTLYARSAALRVPLKLGLTAALSCASFAFVEQPMRRMLNQAGRARMALSLAALGVAVVVMTGQAIRATSFPNLSVNDVRRGGLVFNPREESPSVVLLGDSFASVYGRAMREIARDQHAKVNVLCVVGGDPFPPGDLHREALVWLSGATPDVAVVAAEWSEKIGDDHEKLRAFLDETLAHAHGVILITQPPALPAAGTREVIRSTGLQPIHENPGTTLRRRAANEYLHSLVTDRVHVLDIEPMFVEPDGAVRFTDARGRQLYQDRGHLSGEGAKLVVSRLNGEISTLLASRRGEPNR